MKNSWLFTLVLAQVQRLWTDEEIVAMPATVDVLRRMRRAATTPPSAGLFLKRAFWAAVGKQEPLYSPQETLINAMHLGEAAGDFFAAKLSKIADGTEFERWMDHLSDTQRQYRPYAAATYAKTSLGEVVGYSIIGRMRNLFIDPNYLMQWDLLQNNNFGVRKLSELNQRKLGVISPLSGDYLMACVYSSYLRRTAETTFPVQPAALSANLTTLVLPDEAHKLITESSAVGIYIDTTETGRTGQSLYQRLTELYPDVGIYPPRETGITFKPSAKIERYWKKGK